MMPSKAWREWALSEVGDFFAAVPDAVQYRESMATIIEVAAHADTEMSLARAYLLARAVVRPKKPAKKRKAKRRAKK